jgi:hypothetical protein
MLNAGPILAQTTNTLPRGYVNLTVRAGQFALLGNPLNQPTNSLAGVLPAVPAGTQVFKFDVATQRFPQYVRQTDGTWAEDGAESLR